MVRAQHPVLVDLAAERLVQRHPGGEGAPAVADHDVRAVLAEATGRGLEQEPAVTDDKPEEPQTPVEVLYDINKAPEAVRRMRELIVEAAASGDIERLRPLLGKGVTETQVSIVETEEGPVETLKGQSGDSDGIEVLAILLDVLATGFVHVGQGTPDEMYVWPYFAEKPLAGLTPPEKVELLRIVTAGDYADITAELLDLAVPGRRLVFLEGGYDLDALAACTAATLGAMAGERLHAEEPTCGGPGTEVVAAAAVAHRRAFDR